MGTVQYHLSRSDDFLRCARDAIAAADNRRPFANTSATGRRRRRPDSPAPGSNGDSNAVAVAAAIADAAVDPVALAADCLRRAASHAVTALAAHTGFHHNSPRRLQIALNDAIFTDRLARCHLKTFRHVYSLPDFLNINLNSGRRPLTTPANATAGRPAAPTTAAASRPKRPTARAAGAGQQPASTVLRRVSRRVAALKNAIAALIAGRPKRVRHAQLHRRPDANANSGIGASAGASHPFTPAFGPLDSAGDITQLPNYRRFVAKYQLEGVPIATRPDSSKGYRRAAAARHPCYCHPTIRHLLGDHEANIILTPAWHSALASAYPNLVLPDLIPRHALSPNHPSFRT